MTASFIDWGFREISMAADLLKLYGDNGCPFLEQQGVSVGYNPESDMVYLFDESGDVAVLEDNHLVQFYTCPECGFEGTQWQAVQEGLRNFEDHNGFCSSECQGEN